MPAASELIAHDCTVEKIAEKIGADWLIYGDLSAMYEAAWEGNPTIKHFEDSVFTGEYFTGGVSTFLSRFWSVLGKEPPLFVFQVPLSCSVWAVVHRSNATSAVERSCTDVGGPLGGVGQVNGATGSREAASPGKSARSG